MCFYRHLFPWNTQVRGVNLGGWLVLEPWITPSLFYQFLGKDQGEVAMDLYSFCEVLGPEEANRQLRAHWDSWVTSDIIAELATAGINSIRLPVGDWMYQPYYPYEACTAGALEKVDWLLGEAHSKGISVLIDIHGVLGSQNGFDNSVRVSLFLFFHTRTREKNVDWHNILTSINHEFRCPSPQFQLRCACITPVMLLP